MMLKKITYGCIFFFLGLGISYAEINVGDEKNTAYDADSILQILHRKGTVSPFWMNALVRDGFSKLQLSFDYDQGKFIPIQGATHTRAYRLETEGKTKLNQWNVWGSFGYEKRYEDSTRWRHQTRINPNAPFYFGSIAYNHYERSVYQLKGTVQRNALRDNFPVSLHVNYRVGEHFSNNDPRGSINDFQLNTGLSAGWSFSKTEAGISGGYGYGRERVSIGYKNEMYAQSTAFPNYVNWWMTGYGSARERIRDLNYDSMMKRGRVGLHVAHQLGADAQLLFSGDVEWENQAFVQYISNSPDFFNDVLDFSSTNTNVQMDWVKGKDSDKNSFLLQLSYKNTAANDYNYLIQARNFVLNTNDATTKFVYTRRAERKNLNLIADATYADNRKQEGNVGNEVAYAGIRGGVGVGLLRFLDGARSYGLHVSGHLFQPLQSTLDVPMINESAFYTYVIYHDHIYHQTGYTDLALAADYSFLFNQHIQARLRWSGNYRQAFQSPVLDRNVSTTPGRNLLTSRLSFSVFF